MTEPAEGPARPIVLDSSVLVGYERVKSPGAVMHEAQAWVGGWLLGGGQLLIPALSLTVAAAECGGSLPEVEFLLHGDPEQVFVVPLVQASAIVLGAAFAEASGKDLAELEVAYVVWCATGHDSDLDENGRQEPWSVATYWPDWYAGKNVPVIAL